MQEVEIKLAVAPADAPRVSSVPALRASASRPRARRLHSTYFDTADLRLTRAGITLRLRGQGRRRIQTVKLAGSSAGGLHRRTEIESTLRSDTPDLATIADVPLRERMARVVGDRALVPLFGTVFDRRIWMIENAGGTLEVALDRGEIVAGNRREPICEVEIEVKAGPPAAAFALAREIAGRIEAQPLDRSKFERALALAAPDAPGVNREPPRLAGDDPLPRALAHIVAGCVRALQEAHRGLATDYDVESVHQMRVALRRLAVARRLFPDFAMPDPLVEERRWLHGVLGEARNWDVFCETLLDPVLRAFPERGLAALAESIGGLRGEAHRAALEAARSPRYRVLVLDLMAWAVSLDDSPAAAPARDDDRDGAAARVGPFASRLVRKRWDRLAKALATLPQMAEAERHRTRIRVKRLRYAVDFFADVLPGSLGGRIDKRARKWQTVLGSANDLAVARTLIARLAACPAPDRPRGAAGAPIEAVGSAVGERADALGLAAGERAEAIGLLRGWCAHAADEAARTIARRARR